MKITIELSEDNLKKAIGLLSLSVPEVMDNKDDILKLSSMEVSEETMNELDEEGEIRLGLSILAVTNFVNDKEEKG